MVDRALYDSYHLALSNLSDAAERRIIELMGQIGSLELDGDYVRAAALYDKAVTEFGRVAADAAREFYQTQRDMSDLDTEYVATQGQDIPAAYAARDVSDARHGGMSPAQAVAWLSAKGSKRVLDHADYVIGYNARRDPAHPMWAVVPGPTACGFCVMVASNGWFMHSRPVDAKRHAHCKCNVVADFDTDNPALDGYDPEAMRVAYSRAEETVHDDVERRWDSMTAEERSRYVRNGKVSKDKFKTEQVVAEMDRRDRAWLQNPSKKCLISKEQGAHPLLKERAVARRLSAQGFNVRFIREANGRGVKTADAYLNGDVWEFKVPEGFNEKTVKNQMKKAYGKGTGRLLISCTENNADPQTVTDDVVELFDNGDFAYIEEVLVMASDGSLSRVIRGPRKKSAQTPLN
ncbi:MAG: hypothetical protein ACI360_08545 [Atopobiaceae bacterium]